MSTQLLDMVTDSPMIATSSSVSIQDDATVAEGRDDEDAAANLIVLLLILMLLRSLRGIYFVCVFDIDVVVIGCPTVAVGDATTVTFTHSHRYCVTKYHCNRIKLNLEQTYTIIWI